MSEFILKVGKNNYKGWKNVTVHTALDTIAHTFSFTTSDLYLNDLSSWPIKLEDPCTVYINNTPIITGYVEDFNITYTGTVHSIEIAGRSKTGDLVDCTHIGKNNFWVNQTLLKIITELCTPFNIDVTVEDSVKNALNVKTGQRKIDEGDRIFEFIHRLCNLYGIIPTTTGSGNLLLSGSSRKHTTDNLILGENILIGKGTFSNKRRYRDYLVKGNNGDYDFLESLNITRPFAPATDTGMKRYRPITILADSFVNPATALTRAKWEMTRRAGASRKRTYTLVNATQSDNTPWLLNTLVTIRDSFLGNATMLITDIIYTYDSSRGENVVLEMVDPAAYSLVESVPPVFPSLLDPIVTPKQTTPSGGISYPLPVITP